MPSANIMPALGPPTLSSWIVDVEREVVVHAHADAEHRRAVAVDRGSTSTVCSAPSRTMQRSTPGHPCRARRTASRSSATAFTSVPSSETMTSPSSMTPSAGESSSSATTSTSRGNVVAELGERRRDRVLLRVDHRRLFCCVALFVGDARREDGLDREDRPCCGRTTRASTSSQTGVCARVPDDRHGEQVELAVGRVGRLVGDLDERHLVAVGVLGVPRVS